MTSDRTVRADARANRRRIVEAARSLYAEEGAHISFNAVAQRAGIGNATLYRHFGSQEELREAVLRARMRETTDLLTELAALDDPATELRRYLGWMFETADLSLMGVWPEHGELSADAQADADDLRTRLDDLVARARKAGALRPGIDLGDVAVAAAALVHIARHREITRERGERFLETVLHGLGATQ